MTAWCRPLRGGPGLPLFPIVASDQPLVGGGSAVAGRRCSSEATGSSNPAERDDVTRPGRLAILLTRSSTTLSMPVPAYYHLPKEAQRTRDSRRRNRVKGPLLLWTSYSRQIRPPDAGGPFKGTDTRSLPKVKQRSQLETDAAGCLRARSMNSS